MKKSRSVVLFYLSFALFAFETFFGHIDFINKYKIILSISEILLLILCFVLQSTKYDFKTLFFVILILIGLLVSFLTTNNSIVFMTFLYIICSRNLDFERFVRFDIKLKILFVILLCIFLATGITHNAVLLRIDGTVRNTFGFSSPNTLGIIILSIICDYIYIIRDKIHLYHSFIFIVIALLIMKFSDSRTSSLCIIILAFILPFTKKKIYFKRILPYFIPISIVISLILILKYGEGNSLVYYIDDLVSTRVKCGYNFYREYGISLLGNRFINYSYWIGYANTIDCSYLDLIIRHGVVATIIVIGYSFKLIKKVCYDNKYMIVTILLIFLLCGVFENALLYIVYNIFWLSDPSVLFGKREGEPIVDINGLEGELI